ncbi:MAG TPA: hypothetical protein VJU84_02070 [Pyrinomonadaceae bacterium]|nr:hypothetical protein [Pyrinomonadaceae bacterium]
MKDDYLWDRSGQPDPEIQQLEEILGELRYLPRPLEIPADLKTGSNRSNFYAIAAAVAMIALGLGAWLAVQRQESPVATGPQSPPAEVKTVTPEVSKPTPVIAAADDTTATVGEINRRPARKPQRSRTARTPQLSSEEIAEAVAAKERLMMAMRLASSKLNYAQKKAQGSNPAQPVYHQHKIG